MQVPNKTQLRSLWLKVHKWLGLTLAFPVILIFLSGSALVWKEGLDTLLHPSRQVDAAPSADPLFYASAVASGLAPGESMASLTYPAGKGVVVITVANGESGQRIRYFLHPVTGKLVDTAPVYDRPLAFLHMLHGSLLLSFIGGRIVAWTSVLLLLSAFSGLWLWWPIKGPWVRGLRWGRTRSTNTNIHHHAGFWVAIPLVVLSLTGASISFPRFFNRLLGDASAVQAEAVRLNAPPMGSPRLSVQRALQDGGFRAASRLEKVTWPTTMDSRWRIVFADSAGVHSVTVDDYSGRARPIRREPETAMRLMRRIHDGTGMSFAWQVIIFLSGLIGPLLGVTGVIIWLRGRSRQKTMSRRRAQRSL